MVWLHSKVLIVTMVRSLYERFQILFTPRQSSHYWPTESGARDTLFPYRDLVIITSIGPGTSIQSSLGIPFVIDETIILFPLTSTFHPGVKTSPKVAEAVSLVRRITNTTPHTDSQSESAHRRAIKASEVPTHQRYWSLTDSFGVSLTKK